jgi:RNA polymerase sigma factor (sigma-70 family)
MALSDIELIQRTLDGDQAAFGFLVDKYKGLVHGLAYHKLKDFHHAEDITQETFLKAYQKLSTLRYPQHFRAWIYVIVTRLCKTWLRKKRLPMETIDDIEADEVNSFALAKDADQKTRDIVHDALENLPESERTVLTLHYLTGDSIKEIAHFMGASPGAIYKRMDRARGRMKEEITQIIEQTLGAVQLPSNLTQQIMSKLGELQPTPAPQVKPLIPWIVVATLGLIALFAGLAPQQLMRFQRPYNLNASEPAVLVELIDAPIIDLLVTKPSLVNRAGASNTENAGDGDSATNTLVAASDAQKGALNRSNWTQTNGPYGGNILTLYASPEGTLFAGTGGAGLFRSTDAGNSWTPANTGLQHKDKYDSIAVSALAQKGDILYAGTNAGVYVSPNGGDTWHYITGLQKYVRAVVNIGERIYVGTARDGVWYSDDSGEAWIPINDGLENLEIRTLAAMGSTLFAGTGNSAFRRRAGENSWTPIRAGFAMQATDSNPIRGGSTQSERYSLQTRQARQSVRIGTFAVLDDMLYMSMHTGTYGGLFRSDDEGDSWIPITPELMKQRSIGTLAVSPTSLYAGALGSGVFGSSDGGNSWKVVNSGLKNRLVSALVAVNAETVFVGTQGGGVFRATDGGHSWMESNAGLTNTRVEHLAVVGETIYAEIGKKLVRSIDGGTSWRPVKLGATSAKYRIVALSVSDEKLYVAATRSVIHVEGGDPEVKWGVFQLDAEHNAWIEHAPNRKLNRITSLEIVGTTFYVGTMGDGVFRWEADSNSWIHLGLTRHSVTALSANGKSLCAGTAQGALFRLNDAEDSWVRISTVTNGISALKWVGSTLYATSLGAGVCRSVDGGDSWRPINDGLTDPSVLSIHVEGTTLYIGTVRHGVFRLARYENEWQSFGEMSRRVNSLSAGDGVLYAGTAQSGVFRLLLE